MKRWLVWRNLLSVCYDEPRRGHTRSRSKSYSRSHSYSRSRSRTSRSPSIRRRRGSPSHLDKRRITRWPTWAGLRPFVMDFWSTCLKCSLSPFLSDTQWVFFLCVSDFRYLCVVSVCVWHVFNSLCFDSLCVCLFRSTCYYSYFPFCSLSEVFCVVRCFVFDVVRICLCVCVNVVLEERWMKLQVVILIISLSVNKEQ